MQVILYNTIYVNKGEVEAHMYKALLIAVNEQRFPEISVLPNTLNDVKEINRLLTEEPAFFQQSDVQILSGNLTTKFILSHTLKDFFESASSDDVLFLYWAGHGGSSSTDAYFIPYDANIQDIDQTSIKMSDVKDYIDQTQARTVLSFFDTCQSGAIMRSMDNLMERGLAIKGSGKVVIAACTENQSAWDRDGHGAFTDYLIRGLRGEATNGEGEVDIYSLYTYVSRALAAEYSNQHPVMKSTLSGQPIVIKNASSRESKSFSKQLVETSLQVVDSSGTWFLLGDLNARFSSYRYNQSNKTYMLVLDAKSNSREVEEALKKMWRTEQPFAIENSAAYVRVEEVDVAVKDGDKTINLTLAISANKLGNPLFDQMSVNGFTPDELAYLRIDYYLFNKKHAVHGQMNHSNGLIYGLHSDYKVSERLIPDLLDRGMELECLRLHLVAVLILKSIVAEVNTLNLYVENHMITRITIEGIRPRVYDNVTPSKITVDQQVQYRLN